MMVIHFDYSMTKVLISSQSSKYHASAPPGDNMARSDREHSHERQNDLLFFGYSVVIIHKCCLYLQ